MENRLQAIEATQAKKWNIKSFLGGWWPIFIIALLTGGVLYQQWIITHPLRPQLLRVGEVVPAVKGDDAAGVSREVQFRSSTSTILYVFSPDCVWCQRNANAFEALSKQAAGYRVVGFALKQDGLKAFLGKSSPEASGATIFTVSERVRQQLKLTATPETVLISSAGVVEAVWLGAYTGATGKALSDRLHINLPLVATSDRPGGITLTR